MDRHESDEGLRVAKNARSEIASPFAVGRHDIQAIFGLIAIAIFIYGLLPLVSDYLHPSNPSLLGNKQANSPVFLVDVNSASASELALLPQVGPVLAERIVAERSEDGPFHSVDELTRTPGLGIDRINRLRSLIVAKPIRSTHDQAVYRSAKMPMDGEYQDLPLSRHLQSGSLDAP